MHLNIFIGNIEKYIELRDKDRITYIYTEDDVFTVSFNKTSISKKENLTTTLKIPFISVTRDIGFFKDNITIHCSESSDISENSNSLIHFSHEEKKIADKDTYINFIPSFDVAFEDIENLDESYWRYFREEEKRILKGDDPKSNESFISMKNSNVSKSPNNFMRSQRSKPKLYLLMLRKKNLKLDILKNFEIGKTFNFSNTFVFKIKEISIKFLKPINFCALLNVNNLSILIIST